MKRNEAKLTGVQPIFLKTLYIREDTKVCCVSEIPSYCLWGPLIYTYIQFIWKENEEEHRETH